MTSTTTTTTTPTLQTLVEDLDLAVRRSGSPQSTVDAVSEALRPALTARELLAPAQRIADPIAYKQHLLHVAPDGAFSLVALVWLPGQETPIHDHLAWCVVGVHEGAEYETRYRLTRRGSLVATDEAVALPGEVAGLLPPGDIHRVHNVGDTMAISLHVYGADLRHTGSSIRRRYDHPVVRSR